MAFVLGTAAGAAREGQGLPTALSESGYYGRVATRATAKAKRQQRRQQPMAEEPPSEYDKHRRALALDKLKQDRSRDLTLIIGDESKEFRRTVAGTTSVADRSAVRTELDERFLWDVCQPRPATGAPPRPTSPRPGTDPAPTSPLRSPRSPRRAEPDPSEDPVVGAPGRAMRRRRGSGEPAPEEEAGPVLGPEITMEEIMAVEPRDHEGTVGRGTWREWVNRRGPAPDNVATRAVRRRQRPRHHRPECRFALVSTSRDARNLALQHTFPAPVVNLSDARRVKAEHGAANGRCVRPELEVFFAPMDIVGPGDDGSQLPAEAHPAPGFLDDDLSSIASTAPGDGSRGASRTASSLLPAIGGAAPADRAFLTEGQEAQAPRPRSVASQRSLAPDVAPFEEPPRPHTRSGDYCDCDCTDRSTDDEAQVAAARGDSSATVAAVRLDRWRRSFTRARVQTRARLDARLAEREAQRSAVFQDREHLKVTARDAEQSGHRWALNRAPTVTTPLRTSVWATAFGAMGAAAQEVRHHHERYTALADGLAGCGYPAAEAHLPLCGAIRERCLGRRALDAAFGSAQLTAHAPVMMRHLAGVQAAEVLRDFCGVDNAAFVAILRPVLDALAVEDVTAAEREAVVEAEKAVQRTELQLRELEKARAAANLDRFRTTGRRVSQAAGLFHTRRSTQHSERPGTSVKFDATQSTLDSAL